MTRSLFGGILDEAITHGFSQRRPIRSMQIPPELGKSPTDFTDIHRFFLGRFFCHADFADDADFFHRMTRNLFGGIPAEAINHGFSRRRPGRSVQIPPEVGKSPTDFTDIHRFFHRSFLVTQISQMTQIFLFIGWHGIYSEISWWGNYSRIFTEATWPVGADTPWGWKKSHKEKSVYICEICGTK